MRYAAIYQELDDIADALERKGYTKLAARLDMASNSLEASDRRLESRQSNRRAESLNTDLGGDGATDEILDDSEEGDDMNYYDPFEADVYHKVPVGNDSVSRMLGTPSAADMLNRLDFADNGEMNIQAGRRRKQRSAARRTAEEWTDIDSDDPDDPFTTAGLGAAGDEDEEPPIDRNQEGGTLEFYGTVPAGEFHMPTSEAGGSALPKVERITREAEELGEPDHERSELSISPATYSPAREAAAARNLLRRAAENVIVEDPQRLHDSEEGENVERDQSLGGFGDGPIEESHYEDSPGWPDRSPRMTEEVTGSFARKSLNRRRR